MSIKEGSSGIMIMKSSGVRKIVVSLESDSMYSYRTSSGILSVGQSVSWLVYVIKVATKFNLST